MCAASIGSVMTTFPKQIERGELGRQDALISLNRWRPASGAINQLGQARASRLIARDRNHKSTNKNIITESTIVIN